LISAGALPHIPLGELTALPQNPLAVFKGVEPTSNGREGVDGGGWGMEQGKGEKREGRKGGMAGRSG